jgi:prevent-host-death family protein
MSEIIYNLYEAKTSLSRLVDRAASGEEIILSKAGKPLAKLVPYQQPARPRQPGGWFGLGGRDQGLAWPLGAS